MREPQRQICPLFWKADRISVSNRPGRGASANTSVGFLPPSSSDTFFRRVAQAAAMPWPTAVLPVKLTALMPG